ncbi:MAG: DNA polymerase IV, partial [Pseudomonadales bacterium]|nr:DNA polymerase IV [Pseudomonadales bacterium]
PRFDAYRAASHQIQQIFKRYTERVEPLSLDEAFLDVSDEVVAARRFAGSAQLLAAEILAAISEELSLGASAGVSYNKFLAKLASDRNKPKGLCVIRPGEAVELLSELPVRKFHGIGRATEQRMQKLGIHSGADLRRFSEHALVKHFGKAGRYYYNLVRGIDNRQVNASRERKSIGAERTFHRDIADSSAALEQLDSVLQKVASKLDEKNLLARTLTIKVRYADFTTITRSATTSEGFCNAADMHRALPGLLAKTELGERAVRLLGVSVSGLAPAAQQCQRDAGFQLDLW